MSESPGEIPERFIPAKMRGELTEAEHIGRYWWASMLAEGRTALDAGCGTGYGTNMLAQAGASRAVGVDRAGAVVEAARAESVTDAEFAQGDLLQLPFEDGEFDLVVCFEVIEHIEDRTGALDEMVRVLAPDGLLLVSSPNRDVYVPGNPHHVFEYTPEELRAELERVLPEVELRRQENWIASALVGDDTLAAEGLEPLKGLRAAKVFTTHPGEETYTIAVASRVALPATPEVSVATGVAEVRHWLELYDEQQAVLARQHAHMRNLESDLIQIAELREQLERCEANAAQVPELELERHNLTRELEAEVVGREREVREWRELAEHYQARLERADRVMAAMQASPSWRITAPLRTIKRIAR